MKLGCLLVLHQLRQREIAAAVQLPRLQTGAGGVHQGQTISNENRTDKNRAAVCAQQWWANLDQTPNDLDKTIFRDLSPTPLSWVLEVLSTQAHFFGAAL